MNLKSVRHRLFYTVIALSALVVVISGWLPPMLASFVYWLDLPALHSRFVASVYVYGAVYVGGCALSHSHSTSELKTALQSIFIWNAGISLVSLLNINVFNPSIFSTWGWLLQYVAYAIIALVFLLMRPTTTQPLLGTPVPSWVKRSLQSMGIIISIVALLLLLLPNLMLGVWPWKITALLAQIYSGPLLAIGYSTWRGGSAQGWTELRASLPALFGFVFSALIASLIHFNLFNLGEVADVIWFVAFTAIVIVTGVMNFHLLRPSTRTPKVAL